MSWENMIYVVRNFLFYFFSVFIAGCTVLPTPEDRMALADALASRQGWYAESIQVEQFALAAYLPRRFSKQNILTVYIEGDGLAWIDGETPSYDPTPRYPLGLKLALVHPDGNAAYLARPCQFIGEVAAERCGRDYWTNKRFSPEVITASSSALDILKQRFGAKQLRLVGYSGGGAVAALVASRRDDVVLLVTVAGNLETEVWVRHHRLSPLSGSLNPASARMKLARIKQIHFSGANDRVVPPAIAEAFVLGFPPAQQPKIREMQGYNHSCCWVDNWSELWRWIQRQQTSLSLDEWPPDALYYYKLQVPNSTAQLRIPEYSDDVSTLAP